jgi:hypothetical protein
MNKTTIAITAFVALLAGATACEPLHHPPLAAVRGDAGASDPPDGEGPSSDARRTDAGETDAPKVIGSVPSTAVF